MYICIAHYASASNAFRHGSHSFTCKLHHACLYSPAAEHHRPLAGTHFTIPRRVEGWVDLGGWLRTEIKCRLQELNPDTVTHPSTNRAQHRLTSLISTNDSTTTPRPRHTYSRSSFRVSNLFYNFDVTSELWAEDCREKIRWICNEWEMITVDTGLAGVPCTVPDG